MRALVLASVVLVAACGDDPVKTYSSYQLCFDDKKSQALEPVESIVRCCIDHEVMGEPGPVCGGNEADCINYLTLNLRQTDADITVKQMACAMYVTEKSMQ